MDGPQKKQLRNEEISLNKNKIKHARIALCHKQQELNDSCRNCDKIKKSHVYTEQGNVCEGCSIYEALNTIGEKLSALSQLSRKLRGKEYRKVENKNHANVTRKQKKRGRGVLNVETFVKMKSENLTQYEMANKLGVTESYVSQWKLRNLDEIRKYEKEKLGVPEDKLEKKREKQHVITLEQFVMMNQEGLTQIQMAEKLGVSPSAISHWKKANVEALKDYENIHGITLNKGIGRASPTKKMHLTVDNFIKMKRQGLTQTDIANRLGVTPSAISQWKHYRMKEIKKYEAKNQAVGEASKN